MRSAPLLFVVALLAGGCSLQPRAEEETVPAVSLAPITFTEWQRELGASKGQIVVVDMWATWCAPCLERFPHMVTMHGEYRDEGVRFISMCLDNRDDKEAVEAARQFLIEQNATFTNYLMNENITDAFEKLDLLGIPAVFIYDRQGELRHRLTGDDPNQQFTEKDVEEAITELLRAQE